MKLSKKYQDFLNIFLKYDIKDKGALSMKTKEELLLSVKEDIEAFGKDKLVYAHMSLQNEGTILYGYSYTPEGKFIDEASLEELLIILESDTDM